MTIKAENILKISDSDLPYYKLHLACWNGHEQPLNVYLQDWDKWVGWSEWRGNKNDFNRDFIFSFFAFVGVP